jgi:hypothetical protein
MIFKTILLFTLLIFSLTGYGQKQIRNANWGWSKDSVKKYESLKLISESKDNLMYSGTLDSKKFVIQYRFTKNKLTQVYYIYDETHVNKNNYITSYNGLKGILTRKYNEAITDQIFWKNDLYKDTEDDWGLACSAGHVTFKASWENSETSVILVCTGENFGISLGIVYTSKYYLNLIKEETENQNDKDF